MSIERGDSPCVADSPARECASLWRADEMRRDQRWLLPLSYDHRRELREAVRSTIDNKIAIHAIDRRNFPLPTLGARLADRHRDVVNGCGFTLIRGVPVEGMSREETVRAYFGIGAYFGTAVPQNAKGHLVGHVKDIGHDPNDPKTRIYATSHRQPFHVDSTDIVGLICLRPARRGGASAICSSTSVMQEIADTRPDLMAVLEAPWVYDRKGEIPAGKHETYQIPIVHRHGGYVTVFYARDFIESAQRRFAEVPRLTALQVEALDLVDRLAADPCFRLDMDFRIGDIQFLHNHQILHARTAYEDDPEPERKRHLIRLWLSAHDGRPLPKVFEERYGPMRPGRPRGGIQVPGYLPKTPLDAE